MLCQNCGRNEATIHIKRIVDGESSELHLCSGCAQHLGYAGVHSGIGSNIGALLSRFFPDAAMYPDKDEKRCPGCGATFDEIVRTGVMGCSECYDTFYERLKPSLMRIHGRATHVGKVSATRDDRMERRAELRHLEEARNAAVAAEEYEKAAVLRDQIRELKGETK